MIAKNYSFEPFNTSRNQSKITSIIKTIMDRDPPNPKMTQNNFILDSP